MNENATLSNVKCSLSPYGYPIAEFSPTALTIGRRVVIVSSIIWDADYGYYRAIGNYAKKDGTRSAQIAKPIMAVSEVPSQILFELSSLRG